MSRVLAAILNIVVWGAGYLYRRDRVVLGGLLLAGYLLIHWYWISAVGIGPALTTTESQLVFVGHLFISAGLGHDVYHG